MPSSAWYAAWLKSRCDGTDDATSILAVNEIMSVSGKDFSRCRIAGPQGDLMLSVAVEGGAKMLKQRRNLAVAMLSEHGNWHHVHIGALEAAYGRAPYYIHYMPALRDAILAGGLSLRDFNMRLHKEIVRMLGADTALHMNVGMDEAWRSRGEEVAKTISPGLSVVDALMRFGPETILALHTL